MRRDLFHDDVPVFLRGIGWMLFAAGVAGLFGPVGLWLCSVFVSGVEFPDGFWQLMLLWPATWVLSVGVLFLGALVRPSTWRDAGAWAGWTFVAFPVWTVSFFFVWLTN